MKPWYYMVSCTGWVVCGITSTAVTEKCVKIGPLHCPQLIDNNNSRRVLRFQKLLRGSSFDSHLKRERKETFKTSVRSG